MGVLTDALELCYRLRHKRFTKFFSKDPLPSRHGNCKRQQSPRRLPSPGQGEGMHEFAAPIL
jgi:hypothetical protein